MNENSDLLGSLLGAVGIILVIIFAVWADKKTSDEKDL